MSEYNLRRLTKRRKCIEKGAVKMKKVGFVDYFLDEWHANNYPEMIRMLLRRNDSYHAYGMTDVPERGIKDLV